MPTEEVLQQILAGLANEEIELNDESALNAIANLLASPNKGVASCAVQVLLFCGGSYGKSLIVQMKDCPDMNKSAYSIAQMLGVF